MSVKPALNIIVFGETGAGKSSVINMLDGGSQADVSSQARGVTFASSRYDKIISGSTFRVFDTAGLNEGTEGTVPAKAAFDMLHTLIRQLDTGVSLLLYVMRAPRIKETAQQNYEIFYEIFCQKKVPIVMVVTGLEDEVNIDQWWPNNKHAFDEYKMLFDRVACITATRGKVRGGTHSYQVEYEQSKRKVEALISASCMQKPWQVSAKAWFTSTALRVISFWSRFLDLKSARFVEDLHNALRSYGGLSDEEATAKTKAFSLETSSQKTVPQAPACNVIVFGETGAGKSSVINMLQGGEEASVSDNATGVAFENKAYAKTIKGKDFKIFDTAGLNEATVGKKDAEDAIIGLHRLIHELNDGVSLLVFVMRSPRITRIAQQNYEMFYEVFCDKKVPIVMVVTGLEDREDMNGWWMENQQIFDRYKMQFKNVACITATKGKRKDGHYPHVERYEESKGKVEDLIDNSYLRDAWKMPPTPWIVSATKKLIRLFATILRVEPAALADELDRALQAYAGMTSREAERLRRGNRKSVALK